ncbi:hypothetical protein GCM10022393_43130 [Aquimarina addita]|uniref:Uncharacterized protein n=1 Tax=Aquimarina addita TaxID=870485 RepID=A0ABP6UVT9_9FLAO
MGHNISAIILKGAFEKEKAKELDLIDIDLGFDLTMFHIDHYYSACWQAKLKTKGNLDINNAEYMLYPSEIALSELMVIITKTDKPIFAIISTDYFAGIGVQSANVYEKDTLVDSKIKSINQSLKYLGVKKKLGEDEFDTVGLSKHRWTPEYLEKYYDIADELGV